jgi:hypothetical protein
MRMTIKPLGPAMKDELTGRATIGGHSWACLAIGLPLWSTTGCRPDVLSQLGSGFATTTASSVPDRCGAPQVAHSVDVTRFLAHPCASLTPAQLTNLSIPGPGVPDIDSHTAIYSGPSCSWRKKSCVQAKVAASMTLTTIKAG